MCAFIYGLNDCDERVRKESAEQIRKQTRCHSCCCNDKVVAALTCALSDCDRGVRRAATRALRACGYDVKDCCETGCTMACAPANCGAGACGTSNVIESAPVSTPIPAPAEGDVAPAPAPAPGAEPEAYFPSRLKNQQTKARKSGLANLFGLRG
ncbi:MAG: HEAT repeat domain-containing protein [Planctomycetaceae bacterium]|nr:HEAT repeat domain-containing protein [Planctomycetaceae bacterium]